MKYRKPGVAGMKKGGLKRHELGGGGRRMEVKTERDRSRRRGEREEERAGGVKKKVRR